MSILAAPALPLHTAGPYVAAAYIVFVVLLLIYVGIMSLKLHRAEAALLKLHEELAARDAAAAESETASERAAAERVR
jgi:hypothetical protein